MSRYMLQCTGDTLDELYSNAANIAAAYFGHTAQSVAVAVSETGGLTATVQPTTVVIPGTAPAMPTEAGDGDGDGPANTNPPAYDSAGIPWDERIHAGTKGMNNDGTWKRRRNTSDVTYKIVMAELAQQSAGQQPSTPPAPVAPTVVAPVTASPVGIVDQGPVPIPPPPMATVPAVAAQPAIPTAIPVPPVPAVPAEQPTPSAPVVPTTETVIPTPPAANGMLFQDFMTKIAAAIKDGKFDNTYLTSCLKQWELSDVGQLAVDPIKTKAFYDWLKAAGLVD